MVGVARDLWGSSRPSLLPKQGHLQQAAQDHVQAGLEDLQRRRIHHLPGQPVLVLHHPQSEEALPHVQMELHVLQFVPVAPCPVAGYHWKESGPILTPTLEIFISIYKVPSQPSLLQAKHPTERRKYSCWLLWKEAWKSFRPLLSCSLPSAFSAFLRCDWEVHYIWCTFSLSSLKAIILDFISGLVFLLKRTKKLKS